MTLGLFGGQYGVLCDSEDFPGSQGFEAHTQLRRTSFFSCMKVGTILCTTVIMGDGS